jgi:hypothetical protein
VRRFMAWVSAERSKKRAAMRKAGFLRATFQICSRV